jgi:hypothetical protein
VKAPVVALSQFIREAIEGTSLGCGLPGAGRGVGAARAPIIAPSVAHDDLPVCFTEWVPPAHAACQRAFAGSRYASAVATNFRRKMAQHWVDRHAGLRAGDFAALPKATAKLTPCMSAGFCICGSVLQTFVAQVPPLVQWACCMLGS